MEEEYDIIPSGPVPGQVRRVFTILALPEHGSFTDPGHAPLLANINYSSEDSLRSSGNVKEVVNKRSRYWRFAVCLCLWVSYLIANIALSVMTPFFPQVVSLAAGM